MRGRKTALAFWMIVAAADLALVVSAMGLVTALSVLAALLIVGTVVWQARPQPKVAKSRQRLSQRSI
jgi:uncharacterized protein (DUF58 family)